MPGHYSDFAPGIRQAKQVGTAWNQFYPDFITCHLTKLQVYRLSWLF
jgi:hypothetical protein